MSNKLLSFSIAVGILIPNIVLAEQVIIQQGSSNATAVGNDNYATSSVRQSSTQSRSVNSHSQINSEQISIQQGYSSALAEGNDNSVISNIEQNNVQNQPGDRKDSRSQSAVQNATDNATAVGDRNSITNNTRQYNRQNRWKY